jgi:hypothetical protein
MSAWNSQWDYDADDARANEADSINASRAADLHFTCGHCHQLAKFSELTGYSICCGWSREGQLVQVNGRNDG